MFMPPKGPRLLKLFFTLQVLPNQHSKNIVYSICTATVMAQLLHKDSKAAQLLPSRVQKTSKNNKLLISDTILQLITQRKLTRQSIKNISRMSELAVLMVKCVHFYRTYAKGQSDSSQRDKHKNNEGFSICSKT